MDTNRKRRWVRPVVEVSLPLASCLVGFWFAYQSVWRAGIAEGIIGAFIGLAIYWPMRLLVYVCARVIRFVLHVADDHCKGRHNDQHLTELTMYLRRRARLLRVTAKFSLGLIVISLVVGAYIFVVADTFVEGAEYRERRDAERRITRLVVEDMRELSCEGIQLNVTGGPMTEEKRKGLADELARELRNRRDTISETFLERLVEQLHTHHATVAHRDESGIRIASALSTRIGTVFLLLFLVQIMVTLYRYSTRVAAFYDARADALQVCQSLGDVSFADLSNILSPDGIEFGKMPQSMLDKVVVAAKDVASKSK